MKTHLQFIDKPYFLRRIKVLIGFAIFLALFNLLGCGGSDDATVPQVDNFNLTIQVNSGSISVADAAIVLNVQIVTKVDRNGVSYNHITRYRTDNSGAITILNLPIKDVDEDDINYQFIVYKSGYDSKLIEIGIVDQENISTLVSLTEQSNTTDLQAAFLDYEPKQRASDFLTINNLLFDDITGNLMYSDLSEYKTLAIGYDASKSVDFVDELIANRSKVLAFVENGGTLFFFQQNDAGWDKDFFPDPLSLVDEALGNDLSSGEILDDNHLITSNLVNDDLENWNYTEPGQLDEKEFIVFDAILPPTTSTNWHEIIATPSQTNQSGNSPDLDKNGEPIPALDYWISAELTHGSGKILINQLAYYQGFYGDINNIKSQKITSNVVGYLINAAQ